MACDASYYEENPLREKLREARAAERNLEIATNIARFLLRKLNGVCVSLKRTAAAGHKVEKVNLVIKGCKLAVQHRGYEITATCEDPVALAKEFRKWCADKMT